MYPTGELDRLAQRKTILRARIAVRRYECVIAGAALARPIEAVDRALATWHRIAPFLKLLAVPAGIVLARRWRGGGLGRAGRKVGRLAALVKFLPLILRGIRMLSALRTEHPGRPAASSAGTSGSPMHARV